MENLEDELFRLERRFWTSGAEFYREALSARCVMIVPGVGPMTREAVIEAIAGGDRWGTVEISDGRLLELGGSAALLVYDAEAERASLEEPYRAHVSSLYRREDEGWRLAFHQQTPAR